MAKRIIQAVGGEFCLKMVEGSEDWCSNPRLLESYRHYHQQWRRGHQQQPGLFTTAHRGTSWRGPTYRCWLAPTFTLETILAREYLDQVDHDGAAIEIWRCSLRFR
jgi:hypothetical protein